MGDAFCFPHQLRDPVRGVEFAGRVVCLPDPVQRPGSFYDFFCRCLFAPFIRGASCPIPCRQIPDDLAQALQSNARARCLFSIPSVRRVHGLPRFPFLIMDTVRVYRLPYTRRFPGIRAIRT